MMKELENLFNRIVQRNNINLREFTHDVEPFVRNIIQPNQMTKFYAFYGITPHHPLNFQFRHSNLSGSYFLGKCQATNSLLYKSDIRGDELKKKGDLFRYRNFEIPVTRDEGIEIENSFLIKTLVHNYSHDPETPEKFFIRDTISVHYTNIHGSPTDGSFLGPFSTVDLTTLHDSLIGAFSYIQAGEVSHMNIKPGTVWARKPDVFNFLFRYSLDRLSPYICFEAGAPPRGIFMDFMETYKESFQYIFNVVNIEPSISIPENASLDRFSVVKPKTHISEMSWLPNAPTFKMHGSAKAPMCRKTVTSSIHVWRGLILLRMVQKLLKRIWLRMCLLALTVFYGAGGNPVWPLGRAVSSCPTPSSIFGNR